MSEFYRFHVEIRFTLTHFIILTLTFIQNKYVSCTSVQITRSSLFLVVVFSFSLHISRHAQHWSEEQVHVCTCTHLHQTSALDKYEIRRWESENESLKNTFHIKPRDSSSTLLWKRRNCNINNQDIMLKSFMCACNISVHVNAYEENNLIRVHSFSIMRALRCDVTLYSRRIQSDEATFCCRKESRDLLSQY